MRKCGDCQLCCSLLPMQSAPHPALEDVKKTMIEHGIAKATDFTRMMPDFDKPAGAVCPHQKPGVGCAIHATKPFGCRFWVCSWLSGDDTAELLRPDLAHYVIDSIPDVIKVRDDTTGAIAEVDVIQIWIDPAHMDAHRDPALRAFLVRRGIEGYAALVRIGTRRAFAIFPPNMTTSGEFEEMPESECTGPDILTRARGAH